MKRRPKSALGSTRRDNITALLSDADAPVWHDQEMYREFMDTRGWSMPAAERSGAAASPGNRRAAAAAGWGRENGVTTTSGNPDWHTLRASGLIA